MKSQKVLLLGVCTLLSAAASRARTQDPARNIPATTVDHPGNIFLPGESVTIKVPQASGDWEITPASWTIDLDPMERRALPAQIVIPSAGRAADWVKLRGDFGPAGQSVLAFRLAAKGN